MYIYTPRGGPDRLGEKSEYVFAGYTVLTAEEEETTSDERPMIRAAMTDQGGYCPSEDQHHRCHLERRRYPGRAEGKKGSVDDALLRLKQ